MRHYTSDGSHYDSNEVCAATLEESQDDPVLPKPGISIVTPGSGATLKPGQVVVSGTAEGSYPITAVYVSIDNDSWEKASGTESWTYYWDAANFTGIHRINARSYDGISYSGTAYITILVQGEEADDSEANQMLQMLMDNVVYIALGVIVLTVMIILVKKR